MAKKKRNAVRKIQRTEPVREPEPPEPAAPPAAQAEGDAARADARPSPGNPRAGAKIALGAVGGALLGMAIVAGAFTMQTAFKTVEAVDGIAVEQKAQDEHANQIEEKVEAHVHTWVPNYVNVHHDAVYEDVWHAPVYSQETTYHSVCNDCKEVVDGIAAEHIADTGHSGYSTNVPVVDEVLVQAGYSEPVLVQEAWDEVEIDGATCTGCGEQLSAEQVAADESVAIGIREAS